MKHPVPSIYVASSWRNPHQPWVVEVLRGLGWDVYDFRNPGAGDGGFSWREIGEGWQSWTAAEYVQALQHPASCRGFKNDMDALRRADVCLLVQPAGVSAALEFGWAVGNGALGVVLVPGIREPELMLKMAHGLHLELDGCIAQIRAEWATHASLRRNLPDPD